MALTIFTDSNPEAVHNQQISGAIGNQKNKNSIFAGDSKIAEDPIAQKRKEGQQKAMKVVQDAWKNDQSVDESINARREHYQQMESLKKEAQDELADINSDKAVLKELYGIKDDSVEQQDLELLEKQQDYKNHVGPPLSMEEMDQLAEIEKKPRTEYQKRALELNDRSAGPRINIRDTAKMMQADVENIRSIELERLKSNPLLEAKKEAEAIQEAVNNEVIGMLVGEATDHLDETQEESEEQAKDAMEEKEEQEEQLTAQRENRAIQKAVIEGTKEAADKAKAEAQRSDTPDMQLGDIMDLTKAGGQTSEVQQSLQEIKNSMKLLEADLKGIEVDKKI